MSLHKVYRIERFGDAATGGPLRDTPQPDRVAASIMSEAERAALRDAVRAGAGLRRAAVELAAVIADTARAANAILAGAEEIDSAVDRLRITVRRGAGEADALDDIVDRTVEIFQACDFQDLTGQRIQNVVSILADLEARLGALGGAVGIAPPAPIDPRGGGRAAGGPLENGPRLPSDRGHLTQAEIDRVLRGPPNPRG
ncbi:protein phosphatase CheZ [Alsobacter sp. SYSU M60028]|uniref:Protein phosphatase CheZ n=1 Tax=Alsobacter ponti TaxID=2962936 RepID=A0ABT1LCD2_9HYPH|nr:protein phosphatase CheZ [Alsobacter ponti]MCP8939167.1 protein phosphatase CheZ [Alsobacter ponti]